VQLWFPRIGAGFGIIVCLFWAGTPEMAGAAPALPSVKETAALMAAIDARSLESVRREMQRGADPNAVDASGETALMHAAQCACDVRSLPVSVPIVQLLLDHHAAVNARHCFTRLRADRSRLLACSSVTAPIPTPRAAWAKRHCTCRGCWVPEQ